MKLISRILLFVATILFCLPSYGQIGEGSIHGKVLDRDGKPLQGAQIRVEHLSTHQTDDARTNKNGEYSVAGLFQGQYKVTMILNGQTAMVIGATAGDAIFLATGLDASVNFDLRKAPATAALAAAVAANAAPASGGSKDNDKGKGSDKKAESEMKASFAAGVAALKANNYEEAIKQFKIAAEKDP